MLFFMYHRGTLLSPRVLQRRFESQPPETRRLSRIHPVLHFQVKCLGNPAILARPTYNTHHRRLEVQGVMEHGACLPVLDFHKPWAFGRTSIHCVLGWRLPPWWRRLGNMKSRHKVSVQQGDTEERSQQAASCVSGCLHLNPGDNVVRQGTWSKYLAAFGTLQSSNQLSMQPRSHLHLQESQTCRGGVKNRDRKDLEENVLFKFPTGRLTSIIY